jgi:hypothetical protein
LTLHFALDTCRLLRITYLIFLNALNQIAILASDSAYATAIKNGRLKAAEKNEIFDR